MTKVKRDRVTEYLAAKGFLPNGTPEEIAEAKREYRRTYERMYKRRYRTVHREVRFTLSEAEWRTLRHAAATLGVDIGSYAKDATRSAMTGTTPVATSQVTREVLQQVILARSNIRTLCEAKPATFFGQRVTFQRLEEEVATMERLLREALRHHV